MKKIKTLLFFTCLFSALFILSACSPDNRKETEKSENTPVKITAEENLSPEEVLARMDAAEGVGLIQGPVEVKIISPEEEKFSQGQARNYQASIDGLVNGSSCYCDWKFYLNEYDEETLYQQMNDRQCTGTNTSGSLVCGFTSNFIKSRGDLRVHVDIRVNKDGGVVQTSSAEKKYRVE